MGVSSKPYLFPDLRFYRRICEAGWFGFAWDSSFDKRHKDARRYTIADVNGKLTLTVPIVKPESISNARWEDVLISSHGDWQSVHLTALESAYGRTPFFEFYIDSFRPLFSKEWNGRPLKDFVEESHKIISSHLSTISAACCGLSEADKIRPIEDGNNDEWTEYWQPRAERLGFIGGLSILDALFCIGPETNFLLKDFSCG